MASGCGASTTSRARKLTSLDLKHKMDALVSDLTHALDESQLPQYHKKRRGYKRRSKLANAIGLSLSARLLSEDSSSSLGEVVLSQDNKSSMPLTDSDEGSPPPDHRIRTPHLTHHRIPQALIESDSVNENFSPARSQTRKKQKYKRLAIDPGMPSTSTLNNSLERIPLQGSFRRKKVIKPSSMDTEIKFIEVSAGKRKRGRERSMEWDGSRRYSSSNRSKSNVASHCHRLRIQSHRSSSQLSEECMDLEYSNESSNISDSSSESEAGVYTCDEGREADDEQSDWFSESGPVCGVPGSHNSTRVAHTQSKEASWWTDEDVKLSPSVKAFKERYERMSQESQQACRLRFQKLRERLLRREIRAGRRRLQERRPGFSIISSVNDKVSRFLQDPQQLELHLKPMSDRDRDQLKHLAKLYSLTINSAEDQSAPILTKTRKTLSIQPMDIDALAGPTCSSSFPGGLPTPLSDLKRRRRTPPPSRAPISSQNQNEGSNDSIESVIINPTIQNCSSRPPVPLASWGDDDGDCCADSLSERLADSEPDPIPSPTSLGLNDCTL